MIEYDEIHCFCSQMMWSLPLHDNIHELIIWTLNVIVSRMQWWIDSLNMELVSHILGMASGFKYSNNQLIIAFLEQLVG